MSLNLYADAQGTPLLDNKPVTTHNGFTGGADYFSFYIQNSDPNKSYSNITITLLDVADTGFNWKLYPGSENLSLAEWDEVGQDNSITIFSLTDAQYHQIQCRLYCPAGQDAAEAYVNGELSIQLTANEG